MAGRGRGSVVGHRGAQAGPSRGVDAAWEGDKRRAVEGDDVQGSERLPTCGPGASKRVSQGKNFVPDEERQLARSVLAISQDLVAGNQQRVGVFWHRVFLHYDERRIARRRGFRSLESKGQQLSMM